MKSAPDPDLEIRGGGGGGGLPKTFFRPFGLHFGPKIREGGRAPGPSPESATGNPHPFIYLKPEKGTAFGRSFPVKAIVGSTPHPRGSGPKGVVFDLLSVCVLWPEIGNRLDPYVWV